MIALEIAVLGLVGQSVGVLWRDARGNAPAIALLFEALLIVTLVTAWLLLREARQRHAGRALRDRREVPTMRARGARGDKPKKGGLTCARNSP